MSRPGIRGRLAGAAALAVGVLLVVLALVLQGRLAASLDDQLDRLLAARVGDAVALAASGATGAPTATADDADDADDADEAPVQLLAADGRVVGGSPTLARAVLNAGERADLLGAEDDDEDLDVDRRRVALRDPDDGETESVEARVLARSTRAGTIAVAVAPLEDRDDTLAAMRTTLLVAIPVGVLLAGLGGLLLAGAALRPVEAMRRRAAAVGSSPAGERLPTPPGRDEIARLSATLNAMLERLDEGFARERAFSADASHELRTPLTVLRTELDLALRGERPPEELRAALEAARGEVERLSSLADDLLALARADADAASPRAEVDVTALLEDVRDRWLPTLARDGRTLDVAADSAPARVEADAAALGRALDNLVLNARRHGRGAVTLRADRLDDHAGGIELHVLDEGDGIEPGLRARAFDRFAAGPGAGSARGGTGLGLALLAAIAAAHGGSARIADAPGGGADVSFIILPSSVGHGRDRPRSLPEETP